MEERVNFWSALGCFLLLATISVTLLVYGFEIVPWQNSARVLSICKILSYKPIVAISGNPQLGDLWAGLASELPCALEDELRVVAGGNMTAYQLNHPIDTRVQCYVDCWRSRLYIDLASGSGAIVAGWFMFAFTISSLCLVSALAIFYFKAGRRVNPENKCF